MDRPKLERVTERIWYLPFEKERDRPNLSYIRGDRWSLAIDAGHSREHTELFYGALEEAGLPLPALTVLTHWHWDHTFGMHAVHGLCMANEKTNAYLRDFRERIEREGTAGFLSMDESIRREYAGGRPVVVTAADLVFRDSVQLDPGGYPVTVFRTEAPHTDDSTLILAGTEKMLFLGDSTGGVFPTWERDPELARKLAETVSAAGAEICMPGHWYPLGREEIVQDLLTDDG